MENLSLEQFNPKKSELQELSLKYLNLEIKGVEDITGYKKDKISKSGIVEIIKTFVFGGLFQEFKCTKDIKGNLILFRR